MIDNLRKHSDLYDNVLCPVCQNENETLLHILTCSNHKNGFKMLENEVTTKIDKYIRKYNKPKCSYILKLLESIIFEYKDNAFPLLKERNQLEFTKGLISSIIINNLTKLILIFFFF